MMQVTDTPATSREETPNKIPVITSSNKSSFPLATDELVVEAGFPLLATGELVIETRFPLDDVDVIEITLPLDEDGVVVGEFCVKLWVFIVDVCVVVGSAVVGFVAIVEEGHVWSSNTWPVQCIVIVATHETSSWEEKFRTVL